MTYTDQRFHSASYRCLLRQRLYASASVLSCVAWEAGGANGQAAPYNSLARQMTRAGVGARRGGIAKCWARHRASGAC